MSVERLRTAPFFIYGGMDSLTPFLIFFVLMSVKTCVKVCVKFAHTLKTRDFRHFQPSDAVDKSVVIPFIGVEQKLDATLAYFSCVSPNRRLNMRAHI